jgi:hypothetical protein
MAGSIVAVLGAVAHDAEALPGFLALAADLMSFAPDREFCDSVVAVLASGPISQIGTSKLAQIHLEV